ncbi:MAG: hypothetical protein HC866_25210 [Leptolyngbyaceae cyanobacterium RU_5_1]|nr:hypothetical protein [Leptolyngbyaceae cyanobacterium RU_5_1]
MMKLETEFRVRLQLLRLKWSLQSSSQERTQDPLFAPKSELAPSTWVKLLNPPTPFSADEALLLCPASDNQWLAWVPDYGKMMVDTDDFCRLN